MCSPWWPPSVSVSIRLTPDVVMVQQPRQVDANRKPTMDSTQSWVVAFAGAVATGVAFGTMYTFGAFFDVMATDLGAGRGPAALVFGITLMFFFGLGLITGPLADRNGPRVLVSIGGVVMGLGLWATSTVSSIEVGYVTYGVGVGVGGSMIATPVWASVGMLFRRHRPLAMGLVATGNGLGTLILVPLAQNLIEQHGWRSAYTTLAWVVVVLVVPAGLVMVRPERSGHTPPAREIMRAVAQRSEFKMMFGMAVTFSVSVFIAFGFVVDFTTAAGVDPTRAALLIGLIGASSVVGRLGLTGLAGWFSALRLLQWSLVAQTVAIGIWFVAGGSYPLLVAFAVLMGVAYGGVVSLGPEVMAVLFGTVGVGSIMGMLFVGFAVGGLVGPPLAGWLVDTTDSASVTIIFAMVVAAIGSIFGWQISAPEERL